MRKRFISKKKTQFRLRFSALLFFGILSFAVCLSFFSSFFSKSSVVNFLLKSNLFTDDQKVETDIFDFLLDYTIGRQEYQDEEYIGSESKQEYTPDPAPEENKENPLIYLYNTHQGEEYNGGVLSEHDLVPTVMLASYRLREKLNSYGLNTIVETNQISEILRANNWNYNSSYKASKILMEDAYEKNPTLEYFIDLHRDAIPYESSIVEYNGKTYTKVLFVVGSDNEIYKTNQELATKISDALNNKVPKISKGIMKRGGAGVNGIYNQDFSPNTLLIEIGGQYNSISEVNNTVEVLAAVLNEVINSNG